MPIDLPYTPGSGPEMVVVGAQNKSSLAPFILKALAKSTQSVNRLGVCMTVEFDISGFDPTLHATNYMSKYRKKSVEFGQARDGTRVADTVIRIVKEPEHGTLEPSKSEGKYRDDTYVYTPGPSEGKSGNEFYRGLDHFVMSVSAGGHTVEIHYTVSVVDNVRNERGNVTTDCQEPVWKISYTPTTPTDDPLSTLLPRAIQSLTGFADLAGSSVGETLGTGASAQITLDTTAAGHNWYIDYTPYLNEEYLPTSNPNEWVAKEGSAAAGKMDLLSVLLHEYGHALGLEHSEHGHDLMAPTLAPGVRRLPSQEDLALMARLVGEVKADIEGSAGQGGSVPNAPTPLPFDTNLLGLLLLGRLRRSDYGGLTVEADRVTLLPAAQPVRQQQALNPTLGHTPADWQTTGNVAIDAAGTLTLEEAATAQTRAHQAFTLGANDRYLSFTVADLALDDVANGPDDAFEVALLDANSGASLLGGIGLGQSDALLNLQADGRERLANGVTRTVNADGSRTYLVDLTNLPAGTAAHLSFALIGFAGTGSQATVRDLRLLGAPEVHNDSASGSEDTPVVLDLLANDLGARLPGYTLRVVDGPAHGSLDLDANGQVRYIPDPDWHGRDRFTYVVTNGDAARDSNLASVEIEIAPVNDARR